MIRRSLVAVALICIGGLAQSPAFEVATVTRIPQEQTVVIGFLHSVLI
jgi:hypothetical protein